MIPLIPKRSHGRPMGSPRTAHGPPIRSFCVHLGIIMGSFGDYISIILESFGIISETSLETDPPDLKRICFVLCLTLFWGCFVAQFAKCPPPWPERHLFCFLLFGLFWECFVVQFGKGPPWPLLLTRHLKNKKKSLQLKWMLVFSSRRLCLLLASKAPPLL